MPGQSKKHLERTILDELVLPEVIIQAAGFHRTPPDFSIGPQSIPVYGCVYLLAGHGWLQQAGGRRISLEPNDVFLVFPDTPYAFAALPNTAWDVYWFNFNAPRLGPHFQQAGFTPRHCLRRGCDRELLQQQFETLLKHAAHRPRPNILGVTAPLWGILNEITQRPTVAPRPAQQGLLAARRHIDANLTAVLQIDQLARLAHLSRFHFIRAFKREFSLTPRQYQIAQRMSAARLLLTQGCRVKEAADRVGYADLFYFSRLFKQKCGLPPAQYVKRNQMLQSNRRL